MSQTVEEIERETAELEARIAKARAKKAKRSTPPRRAAQTPRQPKEEDHPLARIQADQRIKNGTAALTNSHGGFAGRTLIQRIEIQMDKCRRKAKTIDDLCWLHRAEGMAAALAILRSSSMDDELARSNERLESGNANHS